MPRISVLQSNFTAGEFSERLGGRTDIDRYGNAAKSLTNVYPVVQGGAVRRPGTRFVKATKLSAKRSRLIPFVFSRDAAYMLEVGDTYVRFFKAGGVDLATEVTSPYTEAQLVGVDYAQGADTMFLSHQAVPIQRLRRFGDTSWDLSAAPFLVTPFDEIGHVLAADLTLSATTGTITVAASAAVFLASDVGRTLVASAGTGKVTAFTDSQHVTVQVSVAFASTSLLSGSWSLDVSPQGFAVPSAKDPVGSVVQIEGAMTRAATLTLTAKTGAITINASTGVFVVGDTGKVLYADSGVVTLTYVSATQCTGTTTADFASLTYSTGAWGITGDVFRPQDQDCFIRLNGGLFQIVAFNNATEVRAKVVTAATSIVAAPPLAWSIEQPVWSASAGYPGTVTIHEQRLVAAGSPRFPQTLWGSRTAEYLDFTKGSDDGDSYSFTIASDEVNPIAYVSSQRSLIAYTYGGEFSVQGGVEKALAPTNVRIRSESSYGAAAIRPVQVAKESVFVQRSGRKVRASSYDFSRDGVVSPDIAVLAEHITAGGITSMGYQQEPDPVLWAARGDGALLSCTVDREQSMVAWAKHYTDGAVESVATIPNGDRDEVWLIVRRTVNGATVRYIEIMDSTFQPVLPGAAYTGYPPAPAAVTYGYTVDCGKAVDNVAGQTVFSVPHLIGKTVDIVADGTVQPQQVVDGSGNVTLSRPSFRTLIGLHFRSEIAMLTPEVGTGTGTAQGNSMRVGEVTVHMLKTIGAQVFDGDGYLVDELSLRQFGAGILDQAVQPFSGITRAEKLGWERGRAELTIVQDQPLPMHVLSVMRKITVND